MVTKKVLVISRIVILFSVMVLPVLITLITLVGITGMIFGIDYIGKKSDSKYSVFEEYILFLKILIGVEENK